MSQLFASSGQSVRVSTTAFPMNTQGWFPLELTGLIFLQSKSLLQHHNSKASILWHSAFFMVQLSHLYVTTGKTIALTIWTFAGKVMSLLFFFFFSFIFISWRLITLQYCSGFCHTLTWISHGFTCVVHPGPPHPTSLPIPSLWVFPVSFLFNMLFFIALNDSIYMILRSRSILNQE